MGRHAVLGTNTVKGGAARHPQRTPGIQGHGEGRPDFVMQAREGKEGMGSSVNHHPQTCFLSLRSSHWLETGTLGPEPRRLQGQGGTVLGEGACLLIFERGGVGDSKQGLLFPDTWCEQKGMLLIHFSRVQLCETPQTAAHQAPPSLRLSRQEHWSGLPKGHRVGVILGSGSREGFYCNKI